ncbi:hypothetical protein ABW20_dc0105565 [Dactylellina cionopaga]|nr:hypothetical protein ABW20_dc0105565 [Dactylellina cionopaga]
MWRSDPKSGSEGSSLTTVSSTRLEIWMRLFNIAKDTKIQYDDALRRIMGQHEIKTEFEAWSTFVLDRLRFTTDYKFHENIGEICSALLDRFEHEMRAQIRTDDEYSLGRFAAAMYTVTNEEYVKANGITHEPVRTKERRQRTRESSFL